MSIPLVIVGLTTEGKTDNEFLPSVVFRTFEEIAQMECRNELDIDLKLLEYSKVGLDFPAKVCKASHVGVENYGIMTLAVHVDADKEGYEKRYEHTIAPAQEALVEQDAPCQILTAVIPVRMIESWMLADKSLFKELIGTTLSDDDLHINRNPEDMGDPKQVIEEAMRIAHANLPKRRKRMSMGEIYNLLGSRIGLDKLSRLASYQKFQDEVRKTYKALGYLY